MLLDLIQNVTLLVTLTALYGLIVRYRKNNPPVWRLITGLWFGLIAIAGMMMPFVYEPGTIYDGRSIILTLSGLFGGGFSSMVSIALAGFWRIHLGGPGMYAGLATIVICTISGLVARRLSGDSPEKISIKNLYLLGLVSQALMLLCQLLVPWPTGIEIIRQIGLPIMVIFPATFLFIALLMGGEVRRFRREKEIREEESLFRTTLYSLGDAVITTDEKGKIRQVNKAAAEITGWPELDAIDLPLQDVFKIFDSEGGPSIIMDLSEEPAKLFPVLLTRSGKMLHIEQKTSLIRDRSDQILGMVIVFRDQTQERLRQKEIEDSEARYRDLIESTDAIAWEYEIPSDRWTYLAPQIEQKLNWKPSDWVNKGFLDSLIHPEDSAKARSLHQSIMADGKPRTLEYRLKTGNGNYVWIRDYITAEPPQAKPVKLRGAMLDITSRKQMELELKSKNDFIQTVLDSLPIGVALNRINEGDALYMNQKFQDIYGWPAETLNSVEEFFVRVYPDEKYRQTLIEKIMSDISSGDPSRMHWEGIQITRQDGSTAIINAVNIPLIEQNMMVSTVIDITEQTIAEQALKESEEKFRKLFEHHAAVHLLIDPDTGKIDNANHAAAEFYGWSEEQLCQMTVGDINPLPMADIRILMDVVRNRQGHYFELKHRLASGEIRDVEIFSSLVDIQGKAYLHSIVHDITEKKELFKEVVKAKERAEESDRLKSAFLANMSHEIRTPLNGILGFTELLAEEPEIDHAKRSEYSRIINRSAETLMQIIDDILDLSKLETGQLAINRDSFNLAEILNVLEKIFAQKIKEKTFDQISLVQLPVSPHQLIFTDRNRFIQIFTNLLDNAVKFTHSGTISFGVRETEKDRIYFEVSDTGIGIPEEKHQLIFNRFTQAGQDIAVKYGGTGLGLSIVKKLIVLLGGDITVSSEIGKGTRFVFYLPLNK